MLFRLAGGDHEVLSSIRGIYQLEVASTQVIYFYTIRNYFNLLADYGIS